MLKLTTKS